MKVLTQIFLTAPQSAYCAFVTGFKHKLTYVMRTIPDIGYLLRTIDECIDTEFIPAITGGHTCNHLERKLLSLPTRMGGLGTPIFSEMSVIEFDNSKTLTNDLTNLIIQQQEVYVTGDPNVKAVKGTIEK